MAPAISAQEPPLLLPPSFRQRPLLRHRLLPAVAAPPVLPWQAAVLPGHARWKQRVRRERGVEDGKGVGISKCAGDGVHADNAERRAAVTTMVVYSGTTFLYDIIGTQLLYGT